MICSFTGPLVTQFLISFRARLVGLFHKHFRPMPAPRTHASFMLARDPTKATALPSAPARIVCVRFAFPAARDKFRGYGYNLVFLPGIPWQMLGTGPRSRGQSAAHHFKFKMNRPGPQ